MEDPIPAQCFILMFIPNENYLPSLFTDSVMQNFLPYTIGEINLKQRETGVVYHSVPLKCLINS